ncbi:hypothetical protein CMO95_01640 [Candidatus Woesearchaeota archaeon]|nr:hypothetical protein [Candidatus Woesearchaeota archaeon]
MSDEVKQEGDFKIKSKPKRKAKNLGDSKDEPVKVDFTKPEAQGEVIPEVAKMDLTKQPEKDAVQTQKTDGGDASIEEPKDSSDSKGMAEEVRDTKQEVEAPITEIIEEITEDTKPVDNMVTDEVSMPERVLPENIDKLVKFMEETGGTVEDYVHLNKDYSTLDNDQLLREHLRQTKPHLDSEDISLILEDFTYEEDIDDPKEIRRKKLAYKEAVAKAKQDLENKKSQYYAEIKNRPGVTQEQQKAMDFFNRYNKQQQTIKQSQELFQKRTNDLFTSEFKGFDYSVGDKKFRYKVKDPVKVAESQSNIENFVKKYLDKDGNISDAAGYHKALYAAMNADKLASHFYEQGKADGVKDIVKKSKNPASEAPRQVASGDVFVGGLQVKAISGADSSKLKIKRRTFNN